MWLVLNILAINMLNHAESLRVIVDIDIHINIKVISDTKSHYSFHPILNYQISLHLVAYSIVLRPLSRKALTADRNFTETCEINEIDCRIFDPTGR